MAGIKKAYLNWSGGKDSALALYYTLRQNSISTAALFTCMNAVHNRITMHGVRNELLVQQAAAIELPLYTASLPEAPSMEEYNAIMQQSVRDLKAAGFAHAVFGDIFLEDLKKYREEQLAQQNITPHFPLWQRNTSQLMQDFFSLRFKAIVVCVNGALLPKEFCGRLLDASFIADLPPGIDPCGEKGEYHSFVFDGPVFKTPVTFKKGAVVSRSYPAPQSGNDCFKEHPEPDYVFHYCDLQPDA